MRTNEQPLPSSLITLEQRLDNVERVVNQLLGRRDVLSSRLALLKKKLVDLAEEEDLLSSARVLLQKVSTLMRMQISDRFAALATSALRFIFQRTDLTFVVELNVRGNLPIASFFVEVDGHRTDPRTALGGSVYEVIGICLRLVCLEFFKLGGPLILDEPLRSVDEENLRSALEFVVQYCRTANRQLFIVTHNQLIADIADVLFEVEQNDGVSVVTEKERHNGGREERDLRP